MACGLVCCGRCLVQKLFPDLRMRELGALLVQVHCTLVDVSGSTKRIDCLVMLVTQVGDLRLRLLSHFLRNKRQ